MPPKLRPLPADYPLIRAWCAMMKSSASYANAECRKARGDGAPQHVIYSKEGELGKVREGRPSYQKPGSPRVWALWDSGMPAGTRGLVKAAARGLGLDEETFTALLDLAEAEGNVPTSV